MAPSVLLFDAESSGHHAEYAGHLTRGLRARTEPGPVVVAVPAEMLGAHPDLLAGDAAAFPLAPPGGPTGPWAASRRDWAQLEAAVEAHRPAAVVLLYADTVLPSLARRVRLPGHPRLLTVHFRPPVPQAGDTLRERVRDVVKRRHLHRALAHPDLHAAFSLDPRAVAGLRRYARSAPVHTLADPVPAPVLSAAERVAAREQVRADYRLGPGRHLMTLFGALARRKGIFETLAAVRALPHALASRLAVAFVGPVTESDEADFARAVAETQAATAATIVVRPGFVREPRDIEATLSAADTVLLPYQRHIGSSAVLIRAAALGRPTVCQDHGLVGAWTRAHGLGRTVDSTDARALSQALRDALADAVGPFDAVRAAAFAASHTPEAFVQTLLGALPGPA